MASLLRSRPANGHQPNLLGANGRAGLRAAVYVRVSSEEQVEGYSLDAQRRAAEQYCQAHDWCIAHTYADEGKSARTDDMTKRPAFRAMLTDAEAGLFDVVLVHKLDSFARNLLVTLETLKRLERCRVAFASIAEQMDFTSPIGNMLLVTLAGFAQYYSDNLSWETRKGKQERKKQGLYNGHLPYGVKKSREGLPVPDPDTYPGLLLAFRLASEGKSDRDIADALNAAGYRTTGAWGRNPFAKDTVRMILLNRFYLGELPDGHGGWLQHGAHAAVLDEELFDAALRARSANRKGAAKVAVSMRRYALSGLARCGQCGGPLHFLTERNGRARVFCYRKGQTAATRCAQRSQFVAPLEDQIGAYLATFRLPDGTVERIIALHERATDARDQGAQRRRELTGRLERIRKSYEWGDKPETEYRQERAEIERELASLSGSTNTADLLAKAADFLRDLPAAWTAASPEQRNALARLVFESVEIKDDRVTAFAVNPDFAPFFADPGNGDPPEPRGPGGLDGWTLDSCTNEAEVTGIRSSSPTRSVSCTRFCTNAPPRCFRARVPPPRARLSSGRSA